MTKEDRLLAVLRRVMGPPPPGLTPTTSLQFDLGMDDLDVVELVVRLEEEFSVVVTEEQGDRLRTWGDVLKLVNKITQKEAAHGLLSERPQQYADTRRTI